MEIMNLGISSIGNAGNVHQSNREMTLTPFLLPRVLVLRCRLNRATSTTIHSIPFSFLMFIRIPRPLFLLLAFLFLFLLTE